MQLHENWKRILGEAWSVRLATLTTVLTSIPAFTPLLDGVVSPKVTAGLAALSALGTILARITAQPTLER